MSEELTHAKLDEIRQRASDELGCVRLTWHECIMLIAAARRALPDDEPITEEWLLAQGWKRIDSRHCVEYPHLTGGIQLLYWTCDNSAGLATSFESIELPITTRSQLTKLVEALGGGA